jgi:hypothetical protein
MTGLSCNYIGKGAPCLGLHTKAHASLQGLSAELEHYSPAEKRAY